MKFIEVHNKAMELADIADLANSKGNTLTAIKLYRMACALEKIAVKQAIENNIDTHQVSMLLNSVLSLTNSCRGK